MVGCAILDVDVVGCEWDVLVSTVHTNKLLFLTSLVLLYHILHLCSAAGGGA